MGGSELPGDPSPGCSQECQMVFVRRIEPYLLILSWKYHSRENYRHSLFYLTDLRNTAHRTKARIPAGKHAARCSWKSQLKDAGLFIKSHCQPLHVFYFLIKEMQRAYTQMPFHTYVSLQNNQKIKIQSIRVSCSRTD